jgi:putative oxidoreductase
MKKVLDFLPSVLLGALFLYGGLSYFLPIGGVLPFTGDAASYYKLLDSSGIMKIVKVLEVIGGALILFPTKRALGLTILAPIIVNIFLFELCFLGAVQVSLVVIVLSAIIAYQQKDKFKALL